jgi:hypothetical protein
MTDCKCMIGNEPQSVCNQCPVHSGTLQTATAPNAKQRVSKAQWKKLGKSSLQFLSASFYVPE